MATESKLRNPLLQGATWLKLGWQLFKRQPITWAVITLILFIACVIGASSTIGRFVVALLAPVFVGGVFMTMEKSAHGEVAQIEGMFSAFKHRPTLKQLLTIGLIGMGITAINTLSAFSIVNTLSGLITLVWIFAVVLAIPLVAIKQQKATQALAGGLGLGLLNMLRIGPFLVMVVLLTILAVLPAGLGLLVLLPVLFCTAYCAFENMYTESTPGASAKATGAGAGPITTDSGEKQENASESIPANPVTKTALAMLRSTAPRREREHFERHFAPDGTRLEEQLPVEEVALPKGMAINHFDDYVCISHRWFTANALMKIVLVSFPLIAGSLMFSLERDSSISVDQQWIPILAPWLLGIFVLIASYVLFAYCLNHTDIFVDAQTIELKHGPIPWRGNRTLQTNNIKQLYVQEVRRKHENGVRYYYNLQIMPHSGSHTSLLRALSSNQQAQFIEQQIEKYLNITNERVPAGS